MTFPCEKTVMVHKYKGLDDSGYNPKPKWGPPTQVPVFGWAIPETLLTITGTELGRMDYDAVVYAQAGGIENRDRVEINGQTYRVEKISNFDDGPPGWLIPNLDVVILKETT